MYGKKYKTMVKREPFTIFKAVVMALFYREIQTRFSSQSMGWVWAVIDPMTQIVVFSLIKVALASGVALQYDYPVFLATGFLFYNLFKSIMLRSMEAFSANGALFNYKQVKPFDTIVARLLVEVLVTFFALLVLLAIGYFMDFDMRVENFNMVFLAALWFVLFGFSLGILFAVIASFFENFKKLVTLTLTPLFFLSGLFYTVDSLPQVVREYILYIPTIHFVEMIHGNYFSALNTQYVDYEYMLYWSIFPLFLGLWMYRRSEEKIIAS